MRFDFELKIDEVRNQNRYHLWPVIHNLSISEILRYKELGCDLLEVMDAK